MAKPILRGPIFGCGMVGMSTSLESLMRESLEQTEKRPVTAELGWFLAVGGGAAVALATVTTVMISLRTGLPDWTMAALCYALFVGPVYL
ncbi:MAG: hypothetical protein EON57_18635, partial [Alphaproteobacteria bacterium]